MLFWIFQISTMNMYYFCNQKKLTRVIWKYASSFRKTVVLFSSWLAKMFSIVKVLVWRRLQQIDSNKYLLSAGGMGAAVPGIAGIQTQGTNHKDEQAKLPALQRSLSLRTLLGRWWSQCRASGHRGVTTEAERHDLRLCFKKAVNMSCHYF